MLENTKLLVEIVQEFLKSWILVFVVFLFSSVILVLAHISSISDTLSTMDMKTIVLIIWLISLAMLIVKGISEIVKRYREKRRIRDILNEMLPQLRKLLIDNYYLLNWSNIPYIAELDELQQG